MSDRGVVRIILGLAALAAACSNPDRMVVDKYFGAVNAKDTQTLGSFAAVGFDKSVRKWTILGAQESPSAPAPMPDLVKSVKDLERQIADNNKAASAYRNDHWNEVEQIRNPAKDAKPSPKLQPIKAEWDGFEAKAHELKKALAEAKDALDKEKRLLVLSLGQLSDLEGLTGEMVTKQVDLKLDVEGQGDQDYTMTLRKYEMTSPAAKGARVLSRWVVLGLKPKA